MASNVFVSGGKLIDEDGRIYKLSARDDGQLDIVLDPDAERVEPRFLDPALATPLESAASASPPRPETEEAIKKKAESDQKVAEAEKKAQELETEAASQAAVADVSARAPLAPVDASTKVSAQSDAEAGLEDKRAQADAARAEAERLRQEARREVADSVQPSSAETDDDKSSRSRKS